MDITSSINSAFSHFNRFQQMSVSSSDASGNQVQFQERESQSTSNGHPRRHPALSLSGGGQSPFAMSPASNLSSAVQNAISYDRSEGGSLQLRTQEGDTVSIKFLNSESYNAQSAQFQNGGTMMSGFSLSGNNSSEFQAIVEGDINDEEMQAIREVMVQAKAMADSFYGGEIKAAFGVASGFSINSEQLVNANLNLRMEETYTYSNQVAEMQTTPATDEATPAQQTQPVAPVVTSTSPTVAPVTTNSQPSVAPAALSQPDVTAVASVPSEPVASNITPETPATVDTPVHTATNPADNLAAALSTITDFLNQLSDSLNAFGQQMQNSGSQSLSFSAGFQLQMMSVMVEQMDSASTDKEPAAHTKLATETFNELAMKMDAQVDSLA